MKTSANYVNKLLENLHRQQQKNGWYGAFLINAIHLFDSPFKEKSFLTREL